MAPSGQKAEIVFSLKVPCTDDQVLANVRHALSLGLPETQTRKLLTVVANGPSAKRAPFEAGTTLALNGALRQFTERGLAPTYWAACDPQALVADFLTDAPEATTYLVASKCHPSVFEALRGRKVILWHIADQTIPGRVRAPLTPSVTMSAIWEMRAAFGFTDFDVWGWDACFMDGEHHAGDHAGAFGDRADFVQVEVPHVGDFDTTHTWAAEAFFDQQQFQIAELQDLKIVINGGGFMAAMHANIPRAA